MDQLDVVGKRVRRTCPGTAFLSSDTNSRMRTDVETAALLSAPPMAFWGLWGLVPHSVAVVRSLHPAACRVQARLEYPGGLAER